MASRGSAVLPLSAPATQVETPDNHTSFSQLALWHKKQATRENQSSSDQCPRGFTSAPISTPFPRHSHTRPHSLESLTPQKNRQKAPPQCLCRRQPRSIPKCEWAFRELEQGQKGWQGSTVKSLEIMRLFLPAPSQPGERSALAFKLGVPA